MRFCVPKNNESETLYSNVEVLWVAIFKSKKNKEIPSLLRKKSNINCANTGGDLPRPRGMWPPPGGFLPHIRLSNKNDINETVNSINVFSKELQKTEHTKGNAMANTKTNDNFSQCNCGKCRISLLGCSLRAPTLYTRHTSPTLRPKHYQTIFHSRRGRSNPFRVIWLCLLSVFLFLSGFLSSFSVEDRSVSLISSFVLRGDLSVFGLSFSLSIEAFSMLLLSFSLFVLFFQEIVFIWRRC